MELLLNTKASCKNHSDICNVCAERFTLFDDFLSTVTSSSLNTIRKRYYEQELRKVQECLHLYVAHLVRGKYQRLQFMKEVDSLKPGKALVVCDYMMKLLLHKFREPQRDWYGKNGVSVHGSMFFFRSDDSADIQVEIHDVFSNGDSTQNWLFTASAFESTFNNFSSTNTNVRSLVIWSDNGPHYHNTSVILWMSRLAELCDLTINRYSFFEAQKGKTLLDSHFATFKFALKGWMKRGFDLMTSEDIVEGTRDRLKGTNVYELHIDRNNEPRSAKTLDGITSFADFTYKDDHTIECRELTNTGVALTLDKKKIEKHWPGYITNHCLSTGVTSDFDKENAEKVEPRFKKKTKPKAKSSKGESLPTTESNSEASSNTCPRCHKVYLRKRPIQHHLSLEKCTQINKSSKTLEEIKASIPVTQAVGLASDVREIRSNRPHHHTPPTADSVTSAVNTLYCFLLQGSAMKNKPRKNTRFTNEQKYIMELCFDSGECDKRHRHTAQSCKKLMQEKLGKKMCLTERQIKSYWGAYKRKKDKTAKRLTDGGS